MSDKTHKTLLIGDNPFHGISHLSQERARIRETESRALAQKADIVLTAVQNGAEGFMFSVSDLTLSILGRLKEKDAIDDVELYAIVPYAFEYVRIATQTGTPGLVKKFAKQIILSGNISALAGSVSAVTRMNPKALMKTYLTYEISRIKSAAGKKADLTSVLLHEVITDMGLALDFDWLFKEFVSYCNRINVMPGFNTRNLCFLTRKFTGWGISLDDMVLATPFNKCGFQMNPSREECEKTLSTYQTPIVLAISVLAAGYYKPAEAIEYVAGLENLKGVVAGASTEDQARKTFTLFQEKLNSCQ
jgi:hypothetical protein